MTMRAYIKAPTPLITDGGGVSPMRNLSNEDVLRLASIQSDLLLGHSKEAEAHIYFKITDRAAFAAFLNALPITSAAAVYRPDGSKKALLTGKKPPNPRFAVAFTLEGLVALDRDPGGVSDVFRQNMHGRAVAELNDPDPSTWVIGKPNDPIDGVLVITGASEADVAHALKGPFAKPHGYRQIGATELGKTRPGDAAGHEHFGFLDGVSQPGLRGCVNAGQTIPLTLNSNMNEPDQGLPGQDLLWPGEFVFGYHAQKAGAASFPEKGEINSPAAWMNDGAFMVIRRLTQLVPEMHQAVAAATPEGQNPEQFAAQLVGRWPNGAPIVTHPDGDDAVIGTDEKTNNKFEFGNDRLGLTCPWGAHIRKTYPRDDVPGEINPLPERIDEAEAATHRHRLLRRGIQFGDELTAEEIAQGKTLQDRGLLFRCYVTDLKQQFEFVQKSWANNANFVQPTSGHDVIIGQAPNGGDRTFVGVGYVDAKPSFAFKPWVNMTGGAYFFAPSIDFLRELQVVA